MTQQKEISNEVIAKFIDSVDEIHRSAVHESLSAKGVALTDKARLEFASDAMFHESGLKETISVPTNIYAALCVNFFAVQELSVGFDIKQVMGDTRHVGALLETAELEGPAQVFRFLQDNFGDTHPELPETVTVKGPLFDLWFEHFREAVQYRLINHLGGPSTEAAGLARSAMSQEWVVGRCRACVTVLIASLLPRQ